MFGEEQAATTSAACGELHAINAVLWVVLENQRARSLYESEGWAADGAVSAEEILGVTVTDVRYRKSLVN